MSYILDALRRADAERAASPGLHPQAPVAATDDDDDTPGPASSGARSARVPGWLPVAAGGLVLAGLLAWWWSPGEGSDVQSAASGKVARSAESGKGLPPIDPAAARTPAGGLPPLPREAVRPPPESRAETPPPRMPADLPAAASPAGALAGRDRLPPAADPTLAARPAAPTASSNDKIWSLTELPDEVRRQLPSLNVGGSVYSADPAARMIMLNGQIFHERDDLGNGAIIEQIRPHQAVLSFRGYRYKIAY